MKREEMIVLARDLIDVGDPESRPQFCLGVAAMIARCTVEKGADTAALTIELLAEIQQPPIGTEQHAAECGLSCPVCRGHEIEADDFDSVAEESTQVVRCVTCKATWTDVFKIQSYRDLVLKNGRKYETSPDEA